MSNANTASTGHEGDHQLIPTGTFVLVWVALLILTGITAGASILFPGRVGVGVAMVVTPIKASLILLYFMHLKYESAVFKAMFLVAVCILAVIMGLTFFDYLYR